MLLQNKSTMEWDAKWGGSLVTPALFVKLLAEGV
jgi:hypothetical protein